MNVLMWLITAMPNKFLSTDFYTEFNNIKSKDNNMTDFLEYVSPRLRQRVEKKKQENNAKKNEQREAIEHHQSGLPQIKDLRDSTTFAEVWDCLS